MANIINSQYRYISSFPEPRNGLKYAAHEITTIDVLIHETSQYVHPVKNDAVPPNAAFTYA